MTTLTASPLHQDRLDPASLAATILAEAFEADPMMTYVFPSQPGRRRHLSRLFHGCVRHAERAGGGTRLADHAVALWLPLARLRMRPADILRAGMLALPLAFGPAAFSRLTHHEEEAESLMLSAGLQGAGYLWSIGTTRSARGQGHGAAMLRKAVADMAGQFSTVALKTENRANVDFYRRAGFEVVAHGITWSSRLPVWVLARSVSPRSP